MVSVVHMGDHKICSESGYCIGVSEESFVMESEVTFISMF